MTSRTWTLTLFILFIASYTSTTFAATVGLGVGAQHQPATGTKTIAKTSDALKHAKQLVDRQQRIGQAFTLISESFPASPNQTLHATEILDTLTAIISAAHQSDETALALEAIGYADELIIRAMNDRELAGHGKIEIAYPFMQSVSRLAHAGIHFDSKLAAEFLVRVGRVARNLEVNPTFPTPGLRGIADSIVAEAKGYALRGDIARATESLALAYRWGFVDFSVALNDEVLCSIDHDGTLAKMTRNARDAYRKTVLGQARNALAGFPRYSLQFSLSGLEAGKTFSNQDYRGKILVLDLGATWCAPCVKSIPHLKELEKEYGQRGVRILNASFENEETIEKKQALLKKFIDENKISYDVALGTEQLKASIPNFQSFPALVFIDRLGNVRYVANGYHDYTQISSIIEAILESESGQYN